MEDNIEMIRSMGFTHVPRDVMVTVTTALLDYMQNVGLTAFACFCF
jgi:hypothetical protein